MHKVMKSTIIVIFCFIAILALSSCEEMMGDFLDKAPGVDVTEDTIFSSRVEVEKFIAGTYERGLHSILPIRGTYHNATYTLSGACISDEAEANEGWYDPQQWNQGSVTEGSSYEDGPRFNYRWDAIRRCNILLERVDEVPGIEQSYANQVKGEALALRADMYLEMFKRYGGVPIVDHRFALDEDFMIPRASVEETVNFIVKDCDDAAALLPESYPSTYRGRFTKTAALAIKSRALLYAASPLFNTASPYLDFGDKNDLICYGNEETNRWQLAADAAKAALDAAAAGGFSLVTDQGEDMNYRYVWEQNDNSEVILANKLNGNSGFWSWPSSGLHPKPLGVSWGGVSATHNFVKMYEKKDGTPMDWNEAGGEGLLAIYANLDPRFYQTMAPVGSKWSNQLGIIESFVGGKHEVGGVGVWVHKWAPYNASWGVRPVYNNILYRVAELYLNYAEALNEAQGPVGAAYDAVNTIRNRSGMPDLPTGLSKEAFRERVRNERAVELSFEEHRFYDIRRWEICENEGVMSGEMYGVKTRKIDGGEYSYEPYVFESRVFHLKMYLHPFPRTEVLKGYLVQNPGY